MLDSVESLGKIEEQPIAPGPFVESPMDGTGDLHELIGSRKMTAEPELCWSKEMVRFDKGIQFSADEAFKNLGDTIQEGNRAVVVGVVLTAFAFV